MMKNSRLNFEADCKTTAMGIMPHRDIESAMKLALSLDVTFFPQLPNISFYEDMYVQTSQNFPGITVDTENAKITFDTNRFEEELNDYSRKMTEPETFALSQQYSATYRRFLAEDLSGYPAVRGQITGPVSFGFRVTDENSRPIIYNEGVRALLYDFIQKKVNLQYRQLKAKNENAFVWMDEPGLGWVFSGLSGYNDMQAKQDYQDFMAGFEGLRALHLCASVNLQYLLTMGVEVLSFDAYQMEIMPKGYASDIADFIKNGGIISWGIVPTDSDNLNRETPETLAERLSTYWEVVSLNTDLSSRQIARQALIAPARCCLKNAGRVGASDEAATCENSTDLTVEEQLVEKAFSYLGELSGILKDKFRL
ncbi:MAG: hypothetical protein Q8Q07_03845 [Dehalococcoidales bacterium]|nr:hypothetical protein [Dehalococcoidales bacterium]